MHVYFLTKLLTSLSSIGLVYLFQILGTTPTIAIYATNNGNTLKLPILLKNSMNSILSCRELKIRVGKREVTKNSFFLLWPSHVLSMQWPLLTSKLICFQNTNGTSMLNINSLFKPVLNNRFDDIFWKCFQIIPHIEKFQATRQQFFMLSRCLQGVQRIHNVKWKTS